MGQERQVDTVPLSALDAGFIFKAGAGKEVDPAFKQRDGQYLIISIDPLLDTITVVGIQIKLAIGFAVVVLALPAISRLIDATLGQMFEAMQTGVRMMLTQG